MVTSCSDLWLRRMEMLVGIYIISIYTHTVWISPAAGLIYLACPVAVPGSQSLQLLAAGHTNVQDHSHILVDGADHDSHTNTYTEVPMTSWSHSQPPCALTLGYTGTLTPDLAPRHPHSPLDPQPFPAAHSAWSSLMITRLHNQTPSSHWHYRPHTCTWTWSQEPLIGK